MKLYGETYELKCGDCEAYAVVNDGGSETAPEYCPYCGSPNIDIKEMD